MKQVVIYLDDRDEYGYKYVVTRDAMPWTAFRTDNGFRNFLKVYGLKINANTTQLIDRRNAGKGRVIVAALHDKKVNDLYFWNRNEVPATAKQTIALCNGNYVNCYVDDHGYSVDFYRPNPNAIGVYAPYDYHTIAQQIG